MMYDGAIMCLKIIRITAYICIPVDAVAAGATLIISMSNALLPQMVYAGQLPHYRKQSASVPPVPWVYVL